MQKEALDNSWYDDEIKALEDIESSILRFAGCFCCGRRIIVLWASCWEPASLLKPDPISGVPDTIPELSSSYSAEKNLAIVLWRAANGGIATSDYNAALDAMGASNILEANVFVGNPGGVRGMML